MSAINDPAAAQDALRPLRNFVSLLSGATQDQTSADSDAYALNMPGGFMAQGPNGIAVEGKPITLAPPGGKPDQSGLLWVGLAAAAVYFLLIRKG